MFLVLTFDFSSQYVKYNLDTKCVKRNHKLLVLLVFIYKDYWKHSVKEFIEYRIANIIYLINYLGKIISIILVLGWQREQNLDYTEKFSVQSNDKLYQLNCFVKW